MKWAISISLIVCAVLLFVAAASHFAMNQATPGVLLVVAGVILLLGGGIQFCILLLRAR